MHRNGQLWRAVSYTTVSAIIAFCMAYWPASAGNILTKFNIVPTHLTSASDIPDRTHKADRLAAIIRATLEDCASHSEPNSQR